LPQDTFEIGKVRDVGKSGDQALDGLLTPPGLTVERNRSTAYSPVRPLSKKFIGSNMTIETPCRVIDVTLEGKAQVSPGVQDRTSSDAKTFAASNPI
jgi:hypothetical protein